LGITIFYFAAGVEYLLHGITIQSSDGFQVSRVNEIEQKLERLRSNILENDHLSQFGSTNSASTGLLAIKSIQPKRTIYLQPCNYFFRY
jgi:hypothetical protein